MDIDRFRANDRQAFRQVFDTFFKSVCLFVNRFVGDLPVAEDIAQETFLALWEHREEMASEAHIKSFLYLSARNSALNHLKHERIRSAYHEQALRELETSEGFVHFVIAEEVERLLLRTREELPPQCRQIFILSMQGKSVEEIALALGVSANTVKTQKKIAYRRLKSHIAAFSTLLGMLPR